MEITKGWGLRSVSSVSNQGHSFTVQCYSAKCAIHNRLTLSAHVAALSRSGYYQLRVRQLRQLVQSMTVEAARIAAAAFISCRLDYYKFAALRAAGHSTAQVATLITGTRRSDHISPYYANYIGYPSESASSSKWHAWFASPGRSLSTWPTTAVSCPTALGALCGQLTFRLAWCREHSVVMATELLHPRDLACGTLFQSSCVILTSPYTDCYDDS